jgi:hypothetical protein
MPNHEANHEAIIREAWVELKRLGLIDVTGVRNGEPVYNFSPQGKQLMDALLAIRPSLHGEELEDALVAKIEHMKGTLS